MMGRVPPPTVDEDIADMDLGAGSVKSVESTDAYVAKVPLASTRAPSYNFDIRFRSDPFARTLYSGAGEASPEIAHSTFGQPRKHSLVRVEDYLPPPTSRFSVDLPFNPYQSQSWAVKPDEFDRDLASPEASPYPQGNFTPIIPSESHSDNHSEERLVGTPVFKIEYDTLNAASRTLGGKKVVKGGEWRKNMQIESNKIQSGRRQSDKEFDEKADIFLGKIPQPEFAVETSVGDALSSLAPFTALFFLLTNIAYIGFRLYYLVKAEQLSSKRYVGAWLFFGVELLYALRFSTSVLKSTLRRMRQSSDRLRIKGDRFLPTVDVLILCTGQHDQIVIDTAMATARLDWPIDRIRILVIDDSCSSELQRRIESFASHRALHLSYHRRTKNSRITDPAALKAALINFGLTETRMHGRQAGEYTLILEAECIPENDILRAMLPYMLGNPQIALIRSQQGFYNLPQRMSASFATYVNAVEPAGDIRSGFAMRRSAVDEIGGFPSGSSVEDKTLACLLSGKGYQSRTLPEVLQYAMLPDSFMAHLHQRLHRVLGPLRTARKLQVFIGSSRLHKMPFASRLGYLVGTLQALFSIDVFCTMFALPVALCIGQFLVPVLNMFQLYNLIRCLFAVTVAERLHELVSNSLLSFIVKSALIIQETQSNFSLRKQWLFLAPYQVPALLSFLVPSYFKTKLVTGWPTDAGNTRDRDIQARRPLLARLASVMNGVGSWIHLVGILFVLGGVAYSAASIIKPAAEGLRNARQTYLLILLSFGWPTLHWVGMINASWTTFACAISPPTVPSRDRLLIREPVTGVARPAPEWQTKRPFAQNRFAEIAITWLGTLYITALFALTFVKGLEL